MSIKKKGDKSPTFLDLPLVLAAFLKTTAYHLLPRQMSHWQLGRWRLLKPLAGMSWRWSHGKTGGWWLCGAWLTLQSPIIWSKPITCLLLWDMVPLTSPGKRFFVSFPSQTSKSSLKTQKSLELASCWMSLSPAWINGIR